MRIKSKGLFFAALGLALGCTIASQGAFAYQVEGQPGKGFLVVDLASTAPVMVINDLWGKRRITPQDYLDKRCAGAKVSEINPVRYINQVNVLSDAIHIVFVMPEHGCHVGTP